MKTALIIFTNAKCEIERGYVDNIRGVYHDGGIDVSVIEVLLSSDDLTFKRRLEEFKDTIDQLVIIGGDIVTFDIKDVIATSFDTAFIENENAKTFFDAVSKANGKVYPEDYTHIPFRQR